MFFACAVRLFWSESCEVVSFQICDLVEPDKNRISGKFLRHHSYLKIPVPTLFGSQARNTNSRQRPPETCSFLDVCVSHCCAKLQWSTAFFDFQHAQNPQKPQMVWVGSNTHRISRKNADFLWRLHRITKNCWVPPFTNPFRNTDCGQSCAKQLENRAF